MKAAKVGPSQVWFQEETLINAQEYWTLNY